MSTETTTEKTGVAVIEATKNNIATFEAKILDSNEEITLTPALIGEKSKSLTELTIAGITDKKGYDAVKKAYNKAVKTRTAIEKLEKAKAGELKTQYDAAKKLVTGAAAELYEVCREVEKNLKDKYTAIDVAQEAENLRIENDRLAKTKEREDKMFSLGMTWNGSFFIGYGKAISKDSLFALEPEQYNGWVEEIAGLQIDAAFTPTPTPAASAGYPSPSAGTGYTRMTNTVSAAPVNDEQKYPGTIHDLRVPAAGIRIVITKGQIPAEDDALVMNDRVNGSPFYLSVLR